MVGIIIRRAARAVADPRTLAGSASAQPGKSDWIDALPSRTAVAQAAFEELQVTAARKNFDNTRDDDAIAINLAGTYVTLREIIYLKRRKELGMSPVRRAKLDRIVASYLEAELTIGRAAAGRRGYITARPPSGLDCKDITCYRRWFELHLNASTSRAEYRQRILNRLFPCGDLAAELDDLRQKRPAGCRTCPHRRSLERSSGTSPVWLQPAATPMAVTATRTASATTGRARRRRLTRAASRWSTPSMPGG